MLLTVLFVKWKCNNLSAAESLCSHCVHRLIPLWPRAVRDTGTGSVTAADTWHLSCLENLLFLLQKQGKWHHKISFPNLWAGGNCCPWVFPVATNYRRTRKRARTEPFLVFLSLQLQLVGMPWQKHRSCSTPTASPFATLHPKIWGQAMPFLPYLSGCSRWPGLFLCHLF